MTTGAAADCVLELLDRGEEVWLVVATGSMRPALRVGDEILVEPTRGGDLSLGDIAVVRTRAGLVAHRYLGRRGGSLLLRGDANRDVDEPHPAGSLCGRVRRVRRNRRERAVRGGHWAGQLACAVVLCSWLARFAAGRRPLRPGTPTAGEGRS